MNYARYVFLVTMLACAPSLFAEQAKVLEELGRSLAVSDTFSGQVNSYDVVFRRDPMQPLLNKDGDLIASSGMRGGLSVQGIIWSDEHPLVVVDNELFGVGAEVGPYLIAQIQQSGIIVIRGNHELFIPLDRGVEPPPVSEPPPSAP